MAETAVSLVIERLAELLIEQPIQKIDFLKKVPRQVERLKTLLVDMQCFLKYAEEKQDDDPRIRNWVSQIRLAAYDAEDVIETFIVKIESLKSKGLFKRFRRLLFLDRLGKDIEHILARIHDIDKSRHTFGIKNVGERRTTRDEELRKLRQSSPFTEDTDLVGLEDKTDSLVEQLVGGDKHRRLVSVVGMPGVGKTTLARKVFNHTRVRSHFDCSAWVYISENCNFREVLGGIIKQLETPTNELLVSLELMQQADLERMLRLKLEGKRYLIVLDDVWEVEVWDCLAGAFPDVGNGSRLLLTSRYENVPQHADPHSIPYKMETLNQNDSWKLFLMKTFGEVNASCPPNLEVIGRRIMCRCGGLPLAITVIGCLLRGISNSESGWQRVLDTISSHLSSGRKPVSAILELSYNDLPRELKSCFLYFACFPEDFEIPTQKLLHLWIAEGLIQPKGAEILEDIAANCLDMLINRNLVQVVALKDDEMVKSCRVHDLLRELAITKAREEILLEKHDLGESQPSAKCRHLALHCRSLSHNYIKHPIPHLRSMLFFKLDGVGPEFHIDLTSFKLLRVLDLENTISKSLPKEIGTLSLLRYLGLRKIRIFKLPVSVGFLSRLQVLDIRARRTTVKVPNIVWKLENLRHLYMDKVQLDEPLKFENLRALQTLTNIHARDLMHNNLMTLTSLRKLGVEVDHGSNIDDICLRISKLGKLRSLCLLMGKRNPSLIGLSSIPQLTKLKLKRPLDMLPGHDHFPSNLSHLYLVSTVLQEDPMPILEKLQHLSVLKLKMAYNGRELQISAKGFVQLKVLELDRMYNLFFLNIGEGAMPDLRCLKITNCYKLNVPSERLKSMTTIRKLDITGVGVQWCPSTGRMTRSLSI